MWKCNCPVVTSDWWSKLLFGEGDTLCLRTKTPRCLGWNVRNLPVTGEILPLCLLMRRSSQPFAPTPPHQLDLHNRLRKSFPASLNYYLKCSQYFLCRRLYGRQRGANWKYLDRNPSVAVLVCFRFQCTSYFGTAQHPSAENVSADALVRHPGWKNRLGFVGHVFQTQSEPKSNIFLVFSEG